MRSPLDFGNSFNYRNVLTTKNLPPYKKTSFGRVPPFFYEAGPFRVSPVIDSDDKLIDTPVFSKQLYPLNQYGAVGGYTQVTDPNILKNKKSNFGEYNIGIANTLKINNKVLLENLS
jgi:hypothetical protein